MNANKCTEFGLTAGEGLAKLRCFQHGLRSQPSFLTAEMLESLTSSFKGKAFEQDFLKAMNFSALFFLQEMLEFGQLNTDKDFNTLAKELFQSSDADLERFFDSMDEDDDDDYFEDED